MGVDISDVPCASCLNGWNTPHTCDEPYFCPCTQREVHNYLNTTTNVGYEDNGPKYSVGDTVMYASKVWTVVETKAWASPSGFGWMFSYMIADGTDAGSLITRAEEQYLRPVTPKAIEEYLNDED